MSIELLALIALTVVVAIVLFVVYMKDSEFSKKLEMFERIIEDIQQQNYSLKKELHEDEKETLHVTSSLDYKEDIERNIDIQMAPLIADIKEIAKITADHHKRLASLENTMKAMNIAAYAKKIKSYMNAGYSKQEIAESMNISVEDVDFILEQSNIN